MKIDMKVLDRNSKVGGKVDVVFSMSPIWKRGVLGLTTNRFLEDGKKINMDTSKMSINNVVEEMDRHSRMLARAEELSG